MSNRSTTEHQSSPIFFQHFVSISTYFLNRCFIFLSFICACRWVPLEASLSSVDRGVFYVHIDLSIAKQNRNKLVNSMLMCLNNVYKRKLTIEVEELRPKRDKLKRLV